MTEYSSRAARSQQRAVEDRGGDWPLATAFFTGVLAMYGFIGYIVYVLV